MKPNFYSFLKSNIAQVASSNVLVTFPHWLIWYNECSGSVHPQNVLFYFKCTGFGPSPLSNMRTLRLIMSHCCSLWKQILYQNVLKTIVTN